MPKRGSWGDRMRIIVPVLYKRVTCATCVHYCHEDHSCMVKPVIPRIDWFDCWKKCKQFELLPGYYDDAHKMQVIKIKGNAFFDKSKQVKDSNTSGTSVKLNLLDEYTSIQQPQKAEETRIKSFSEQFVYFAKINHGIEFVEISIPDLPRLQNVRCLIDNGKKIIVMTMPKIKQKKISKSANLKKVF